MMPSMNLNQDASDSEDDEDYIPPAGKESESETSENEDETNAHINVEPTPTEEERKRARDALWASFQESLAKPETKPPQPTAPKMVTIQKKYLFAGEEVSEVVEVPEDSPEAKKWPLFTGSEKLSTSTPPSESKPGTQDSPPAQIPEPSSESTPSESTSTTSTTLPTPAPKPAPKRPGPRKSKISLTPLPGTSKPKKLTTLDKSAMDWKSHLQSEQASGSGIADELEAHRKGGGYLEKVEFLKRVEERKEDTLESLKSNKRRRL